MVGKSSKECVRRKRLRTIYRGVGYSVPSHEWMVVFFTKGELGTELGLIERVFMEFARTGS